MLFHRAHAAAWARTRAAAHWRLFGSGPGPRQGKYIAVIDEGTTSTRTVLFDRTTGELQFASQQEFTQIMPRQGWVEHDPLEILEVTKGTVEGAMRKAGAAVADVACLGITNQRETTVVWDRRTGQPLHNAIVWMDTRADALCRDVEQQHGGPDAFRETTGLPVHAYFSGPKVRWLLEHADGVRAAAERGDALFGTVDSWLLWNLTGGAAGVDAGTTVHATDVSNASRTLLMSLDTMDWDDRLLDAFGVPRAMLPTIAPSSATSSFGTVAPATTVGGDRGGGGGGGGGLDALAGVPITGILGDQQAALFGQGCFEPGRAKCTYGTGAFALTNIGAEKRVSRHGLLTTVSYQLEGQPAVYALEGSVAIGGAVIQWLRDNLGLISAADEVDALARTVDDNGGMYFVPAFSGLYAPYWRPDARGCMVGLTRFVTKAHFARAALEAVAFQVRDVLAAMAADSGTDLRSLHVDGGATNSELLMQFQSDLLCIPVAKPQGADNTTALGAAFAAGLGSGVYGSIEEVAALVHQQKAWTPAMGERERREHLRQWKKAIERSLHWVDDGGEGGDGEGGDGEGEGGDGEGGDAGVAGAV